MKYPKRKTSFFSAGSITDYLAFAAGLILLIIYHRKPLLYYGWGTELRVVYHLLAIGLIMWGIHKPIGHLLPFLQVFNQEKRSKRTISWIGIILVFIGMELIYWALTNTVNQVSPLLIILLGAYLIFWGSKEILIRQIPSLRSVRAKQRVMLPRPGVVYLLMMFVMLGGALLGHSNMLMLVFSLMAGPFILNGWITFTMLKKLNVSRELPAQVMAGERLMIDVTLVNKKWWFSSWLMTATDYIRNNHEELVAKLLFVRVPAKNNRVGQYEICLMQRGRYLFGPLRISSRFPLGLTERGLKFEQDAELLVLPRLGKLTHIWHRTIQQATELVEQEQQSHSTFDDEFHSIREYRRGDNPRAIHWRTSARQNELMVREYRQSRDSHLVLLLDLWEPDDKTIIDISLVEQLISFAATIVVEKMKSGRNALIHVVSSGKDVSYWQGEGTPGNMESILRNLAEVQSGVNPDITPFVETASSTRAANRQVILLSTRPFETLSAESNSENNLVTLLQETVGNNLFVVSAKEDIFQQYFVLSNL